MNQTAPRSAMNDKPRVLMLVHRFPFPPDRGDRIRAYHLLKFLSQDFNLSLACPTHHSIEAAAVQHVQTLVSELLVAPIGRWTKFRRAAMSAIGGASLSEGFFNAPQLIRSIQDWHAKRPFDALLVVCSSMYRYRKLSHLEHVPTIIDLVDVDSQKWRQLAQDTPGWRRPIYRWEHQRTALLEKRIASEASAVALTSPQEVDLFRQCCPVPVPAYGIGNGVDTHYFRPNAERIPCATGKLNVVFTGVMDYPPNVDGMLWFCRQIWPQVVSRVPATLQIVGRNPTSAVKALAALPAVQVIGEVADVRPYLATADLAISPLLLARGIQNKVLEAMASGLATVVTPQSAEGIAATPGVHLQVAANAEDFAQSLVELASSPAARTRLGLAGRQFVEQHHSWPAQLAPFKELLERCLEARTACGPTDQSP